MVMNAFDTNFDDENEVYAVNTVAHAYSKRPIVIDRARPVRVYLVNVTEFDPINSFHLHGNFFDYYDHGTTLTPTSRTIDTVMQCQAQRGILEFSFAAARARALHVPCPPVRVRRARLDEPVRRAGRGRPHEPAARRLGAAAAGAPDRADRLARSWLRDPLRPFSARACRRSRSSRSSAPCSTATASRLLVRAGGSEPIQIAQVQVDGAYWTFTQDPPGALPRLSTAWLRIPYPWVLGETHHVVMLSRAGVAVRAHDRRGACATPTRGSLRRARAGRPVRRRRAGRARACCSTRRSGPAAAAPSTSRSRSPSGCSLFLLVDTLEEALELAGEAAPGFHGGGHGLAGRRAHGGLLLLAVGPPRRRQARGGSRSRPRSRSASACTTSARASRSARRSRPAPRRSAPSWCSASRSTTSPRASASSRPGRGAAAAAGLRRPGRARGRCRPSWASGSAATPSRRTGRRWRFAVGAGAILQVIVEVGLLLRAPQRARQEGSVADGDGRRRRGGRRGRHVRDRASGAGSSGRRLRHRRLRQASDRSSSSRMASPMPEVETLASPGPAMSAVR